MIFRGYLVAFHPPPPPHTIDWHQVGFIYVQICEAVWAESRTQSTTHLKSYIKYAEKLSFLRPCPACGYIYIYIYISKHMQTTSCSRPTTCTRIQRSPRRACLSSHRAGWRTNVTTCVEYDPRDPPLNMQRWSTRQTARIAIQAKPSQRDN